MSNLTRHDQTEEDGSVTTYIIWNPDTNSKGDNYDSYCMFQLREQRNLKLSQSDWTQNRDITLSNDSNWKTYREELRDLPSTASPELDSDGKLTNVT